MDELSALWPPPGPAEWAVSSALRAVRKSLGTLGVADRVGIEARRGRGYRLVAEQIAIEVSSAASEGDPFVGRGHEIERLTHALARSFAGEPRVVLVGGAAGLGKSRLATELASLAAARGGAVLWGRCGERDDSVLRPWVEIVEGLSEAYESGWVTSVLRPLAPELGRVLPALKDRFGNSAPSSREDPEMARLILLDGFVDLFDRVARHRPCVLIVDDLHWADPSSLLLLRALAVASTDAPRLVVGTFRDDEAQTQTSVAEALSALDRVEAVETVRLSPLSEGDAERVFEGMGAGVVFEARRDELCRVAGGNPLFLKELWRNAQEGADDSTLPMEVERLIAHRLARRTPAARRVLASASVIGTEFRADLLRTLELVPGPADLANALDELTRAHLLRPPEAPSRPYRFEHELTRQVAYAELSDDRRAQLHLAVGERLESELSGSGFEDATLESVTGEHAALLARHFDLAAAVGGASRAFRYRRLAGAEAYRRFAFEQAAEHLSRAAALFDQGEPNGRDPSEERRTDEQRCELLIDLANAARMAGDGATAERARIDALPLARGLEDPEYLARCAASELLMPWKNTEAAALHEEALARLSDVPTPLRAIVSAGLAQRLLDLPGTRARRKELVDEALGISERAGDPIARHYVLEAAFAAMNAQEFMDLRLACADELVESGRGGGSAWAMAQGHMYRHAVLLQRGRLAEARAEQEEIAALARRHPWPRLQWAATSLRFVGAFIDGRLDEAEASATEAGDLARATGQRTGVIALVFQLPTLRREQDRLAEIVPLLEQFAGGLPRFAWGVDLIRGQAGDRDAVRRLLTKTFDEDAGLLQHDSDVVRFVALCWLAAACADVGEDHRADRLLEALGPAEDSWAIAVTGFNTFGSVRRALGLVEMLRRRWDPAVALLERALEEHEQPGATLLRAWTSFDLAQALRGRDRHSDRERAARALDEAHALAVRSNLTLLRRRIESADSTVVEHGSAALRGAPSEG